MRFDVLLLLIVASFILEAVFKKHRQDNRRANRRGKISDADVFPDY